MRRDVTYADYSPGHPWYYFLGGRVLPPKAIRAIVRAHGTHGYRRDEIRRAAAQPEPSRSEALRKIRIDVMRSLKSNISIYREVARDLRRYRIETADQPRPAACANVHTAMSLKFAHLCNDFAHIDLLDATPQQADLFDAL
jgi:hypothetical protein